jgi:predicted nucleotidyltransferase
MNRDTVLKKLSKHQVELESRFGVKSLSLFGSVARNEAVSASDLDILVTFINTPGIFGFINLKLYLENIFKCSVDLVTNNALKKQLREHILQEAIYAF